MKRRAAGPGTHPEQFVALPVGPAHGRRIGRGRRLLRIFATLVIRGERIWRGWSLHLTVLAILLVGGALAAAVAEAGADVYEDVQHQSGIAGMGNMQIYLPQQNVHTTLDFHGRAPSAVRQT